jgi:hypothetical protein
LIGLVAAIAKPLLLLFRGPVRHVLVALVCLAVCMPPCLAEAVVSERATVTATVPLAAVDDIALGDGGTFRGQLIDSQRVPRSGVRIELRRGLRQVGQAVTGRAGRFVMTGLHGGLYQLITPQSSRLVRLWTSSAAPPSARQDTLFLVPRTLVRGQSPRPYRFSSNAMLLGALVVAGATIPWIINGSRSNDSSGS